MLDQNSHSDNEKDSIEKITRDIESVRDLYLEKGLRINASGNEDIPISN